MRKLHYTENESGIDFTAVMDIAFLVMVLFFATTVYLVESGHDSATVKPEGPSVLVEIDAAGLITIDGRLRERSMVREALMRLKSEYPDVHITIDTHPDADSESVATVIDAVRATGGFFEVIGGEES